MGLKYRKVLDNITPYQPGKPIEEVKRELALKEVFKLASNENALHPSPKVVDAVARAMQDVNRYPDGGCFYIREALSKKLGISGDNIIFGNGSDEVIIFAIRALVSPGDEVIVSDLTFLIYQIAATVENADVKVVPAKGYGYDLDAILDSITDKTKMIFIANPNNPTGSYISDTELKNFIEKVPRDVVIFLDEAYYEFAKGDDYPETLSLIENEERNVIIARTFSKAYGLAGLRIGYGLARGEIIKILNKVREPFNVNSLAQAAAIAALEDDEYLKDSVDLVEKGKKDFFKRLEALDVVPIPGRANFVLINTNRDSVKIADYLQRKGIIVREMSPWGLTGHIRVNIGLSEENNRFFEVFEEALKR